ncbi:MAG TPA: hypothetical protein VNZ86_07310, partial [Bacteroidia bacterium]|nr:hypothetical protein [Bacteroidia bacterium]
VDIQGNVLAAIPGVGVFRSPDTGNTWSSISSGLTSLNVNALLVTPSGIVFAATDSGVFQLLVGASGWIQYSLGLSTKRILSLTYNSAGKLFAGSDGNGVYAGTQLFNVSHKSPGLIQASDLDFGAVIVGKDTCEDLLIRNVGSSAVTLDNSYLQYDTIDFSVDPQTAGGFPLNINPNTSVKIRVCFHPQKTGSDSADITWISDIDSVLDGAMKNRSSIRGQAIIKSGVIGSSYAPSQFTIFPDPVTGNSVSVSFSGLEYRMATLLITDAIGREVFRQAILPGSRELELPVTDLSSGLFNVRITTEKSSITGRFLKSR